MNPEVHESNVVSVWILNSLKWSCTQLCFTGNNHIGYGTGKTNMEPNNHLSSCKISDPLSILLTAIQTDYILKEQHASLFISWLFSIFVCFSRSGAAWSQPLLITSIQPTSSGCLARAVTSTRLSCSPTPRTSYESGCSYASDGVSNETFHIFS